MNLVGKYGVFFAGAVLLSAPFAGPIAAAGPRYFPAAWLIPPVLDNTPEPVSLAVSPYLGYQRAPVVRVPMKNPLLVYGELLGTQPGGKLGVLATQLWLGDYTGDPKQYENWAADTLSRLAPDSRAGLVRLRSVVPGHTADGAETATVAYTLLRLKLQFERPLARKAHPLRTQLQRLRFAEGQYGGARIPAPLADLEAAPPQVRDVQPIRFEHRPSGDDWPWGVSALRLRTRYAEQGGAPAGIAGMKGAGSLWWQACAHGVQFQVGEEGAGQLPPLFRAPAILSLLPAPPDPALPPVGLKPEPLSPPPPVEDDDWQPLLPGSADCLLDGARPGAGFVMRSHLQRQSNAGVDRSGAVPVQHRMPRPVSLRANSAGARQFALRTWAGYFAPEELLSATLDPVGNGFIEPAANDLKSEPDGRRVRLCVNGYMPGETIQQYVRDGWLGTLHKLGVETIPLARLVGADSDSVYFEHTTSSQPVVCDGVETLVTALAREAEGELEQALEGWGGEVVAIGDCAAPRTAEEAVLEGLKVAWAI